MKTPASIETLNTAAEKACAFHVFFYSTAWARVTKAIHFKACILILFCILWPGYGDTYVTYAVGSAAVYTTGRALMYNGAAKKREVFESEPSAECSKAGGSCSRSEGSTDGSLWN